MERPALKRLLTDINAGRIDVIVVYKVDRLTRSLADFGRMVDVFERHDVSFVSVTQSFNTTSSMGRLTLNVLLSFAQFEREVTGERIRDKIAASKARGMWMGGYPPLGYDPHQRALAINEPEAATVRHVFRRYLDLGSVHALATELARDGVTSKRWTSGSGVTRGGVMLTRGALFHMLRNRIYLGEIVHKGNAHPGQHAPIVNVQTFEAVQAKLKENAKARRDQISVRSPLTGLLRDAEGNRMSPTHTRNRHGRRYLYYVSAPLQTGGRTREDILQRVPAKALEEAVLDRLRRWSRRPAALMPELTPFVTKVEVHHDSLLFDLAPPLHEDWAANIDSPERVVQTSEELLQVRSPVKVCSRGGRTWLTGATGPCKSRPNSVLIAALKRAHAELQIRGIDVTRQRPRLSEPRGVEDPYLRKLTTLAFLAPDIQKALLQGRQPAGLNLATILSRRLPLDWVEQRRLLGFET
jgi:DNA invertase Pin-like site-specific DNA recombinase